MTDEEAKKLSVDRGGQPSYWRDISENRRSSIMIAPYPESQPGKIDNKVEELMDQVKAAVKVVRRLKALLGIRPSDSASVSIEGFSHPDQSRYVETLAHVTTRESISDITHISDQDKGITVAMVIPESVDVQVLYQRIHRDLLDLKKEMVAVANKLDNPDFINRAPADVVERECARSDELSEKHKFLSDQLYLLELIELEQVETIN